MTEGHFYFTGLPEAVFVNGDGTIADIHYGALTPAQLVQWQQPAPDRGLSGRPLRRGVLTPSGR